MNANQDLVCVFRSDRHAHSVHERLQPQSGPIWICWFEVIVDKNSVGLCLHAKQVTAIETSSGLIFSVRKFFRCSNYYDYLNINIQ